MQTLRRWRDLIGCRVYGHYWWTKSGVHADPADDGSLDVSLEIHYDKCKRCGAMPEDPLVYDERALNISVSNYTITVSHEGPTNVHLEHNVELFDVDPELVKSRTYVRKAVKK